MVLRALREGGGRPWVMLFILRHRGMGEANKMTGMRFELPYLFSAQGNKCVSFEMDERLPLSILKHFGMVKKVMR